VAQQHDGDQGGQLPPDGVRFDQAKLHDPRKNQRHRDRQGYQGHHPRQACLQLVPRPFQKRQAAIEKDDGGEHRGNPARSGEHGGGVAKKRLDVLCPDDDRNGEDQGEPEPVAEHLRGVACVPVVARMAGGRFPVPAVCLMVHVRLGSVAVSVVGGLAHAAVSSKVDNRFVIPRMVRPVGQAGDPWRLPFSIHPGLSIGHQAWRTGWFSPSPASGGGLGRGNIHRQQGWISLFPPPQPLPRLRERGYWTIRVHRSSFADSFAFRRLAHLFGGCPASCNARCAS